MPVWGVRSVRYYRKMSNQMMADETREARQKMSDIIMQIWKDGVMNMKKYDKMRETEKRARI